MIFFVGNDGTIIKTVPEPVYQGSSGANNIYVVAPFAAGMTVTVAFQLPNGVWTTPRLMKSGAVRGDEMAQVGENIVDEAGNVYACWSYSLPSDITAYYGTVTAQFFFYAANNVVTASASANFTVGRGVPPDLSGIEAPDVYTAILENITALQTALTQGQYAARSFYPWNSQVTYNAGEIVYYPSVGEYGVFVKALTQNTNKPPYVNGTLDTTNWAEVVDFNMLNDLYDLKEEVQQAVEDASQSASESAASASESASHAEEATTSAGKAAASAQEAQETVNGLKDIIPSTASPENPLTTRDFVNSSINNMAAFYITYDAQGNAFPTRASLLNATVFYQGGKPRVPTQNDYAIVRADESQPQSVNGSYPTTRYSYQGGTYPEGQWSFQYVVNNTALTQDQIDAINSGITAPLVNKIGANETAIEGLTETSEKNLYNLGVYDTYVSNGNGTGTVTRKTLLITKNEITSYALNGVAPYPAFHIISDILKVSTGNVKINIEGYTSYDFNATSGNISFINASVNLTAQQLDELIQNIVIAVEADEAHTYTEQVIENQPIHIANQEENNYWHEEWRKGLNLLEDISPYGSAGMEFDTTKGNTFSVTITDGDPYFRTNVLGDLEPGVYTLSVSDPSIEIWIWNDTTNVQSKNTFIKGTGQETFHVEIEGATIGNTYLLDFMLVKGINPYPYEPYNGEILRQKDLDEYLPSAVKNSGSDGNITFSTAWVYDTTSFAAWDGTQLKSISLSSLRELLGIGHLHKVSITFTSGNASVDLYLNIFSQSNIQYTNIISLRLLLLQKNGSVFACGGSVTISGQAYPVNSCYILGNNLIVEYFQGTTPKAISVQYIMSTDITVKDDVV